MRLLHFLIIAVPIAISLIVIAIYTIIPVVMPVQPVTVTIIGSNPYILHEGDKFSLDVSVINPNFFTIDLDSASTTFDKNAVEYHYDGCGCCGIDYKFGSLESTRIIIPISCAYDVANTTGKTNATTQIQYHVNGKSYSVSASKTFTILPRDWSYRNGTLEERNQSLR